MQVEFICPQCGTHLAWALPDMEMSCPKCGNWVTYENRKKPKLDLLLPMGVLTLCAYPGHEEGERELEAVTRFLSSLSPRSFNVLEHRFLNAGSGAPVCFVVQRQPESSRRPNG